MKQIEQQMQEGIEQLTAQMTADGIPSVVAQEAAAAAFAAQPPLAQGGKFSDVCRWMGDYYNAIAEVLSRAGY